MSHPSRHLWPALQRRFTDQNKPSTAPDRLLRAFSVVPLEGQEESAAWTLGFKEVGSTLRTVSLSRDFNAVSAMVDPAVPCYLVVYVGDVQQLDAPKPVGMEVPKEWMLISYVPSSCTSFEAKKMADNRAGLKAGLGADRFTEGGMWCVHVEQISLSNYMRAAESAAGEDAGMPPAAAEESFLPPSRPEPPSVQPEPRKKDAVAELRSGVAPTDAALAAAVSTNAAGAAAARLRRGRRRAGGRDGGHLGGADQGRAPCVHRLVLAARRRARGARGDALQPLGRAVPSG